MTKFLYLPEYVKPCPACGGDGEYEQMYTAGCGGGYYKSVGPCDYCKREGEYSYRGVGYVYKNDIGYRNRGVPKSVIEQLKHMNPDLQEVSDV